MDGIAANPGIAQFVSRLYAEALGRTGEAAGINDWTTRIANKEWKAERVATDGFFHSVEFQIRNLSDSEFLDVLYATFFDRQADPEGKEDWMNHLSVGMTRDNVILGFSGSQEFVGLLEQYGLYEEEVKKTVYLLSQAVRTFDSSTEVLTCQYDANGNIIRKSKRDDFGLCVVEMFYDSENRITKKVCSDGNGNLVDYILLEDEEDDEYGYTAHRNTVYEYDSHGNTEKVVYGDRITTYQYTYDEHGNLATEQMFGDGVCTLRTDRTYISMEIKVN